MKIKLFITGGTIDKNYNELTGELDYKETHIERMLEQARCRADLETEELMLVDSLDMTDSQRQEIVQVCNGTNNDRIVITHGTDTIVETAQLLANNVQDKTVVISGSMVPYVFGNSDALFNIGAAITAAQILAPGTYITMNGKVFTWDNVTKNRELGEFCTTD